MIDDIQRKKAAILKGIAHPVRMTIVEALARREMCVCDIAEMFHFDRTTISKHLALMKSLGMLEDRREGLNVYYSLRMSCLAPLLACVERVARGEEPGLFATACACGVSMEEDDTDEDSDTGSRVR
ncbi:MAG: metalloregulator ArsR/SmtB family transcription factor [Aminobacteriaceae bacterium]